jgi:pyridinium-3,5-biscarboxylic acid mononucleotide synthase
VDVTMPPSPSQVLAGFAELDHDRAMRRGYPEAILCEGKTPQQVAAIAGAVADHAAGAVADHAAGAVADHAAGATLFTRASQAHADAVLSVLPRAFHDPAARLLAWPPDPPAPTGGRVVVVAAGTSDLPVAREAELTSTFLGRRTTLVVDVGVAGLHRILQRLDLVRQARVVVVVAGMDGALPGVVAGLVSAPVVAVPTSVGYGAAFEGLAALLTMLNACAPGVGVVNIDNGYGAGHLAAQIAADCGSTP